MSPRLRTALILLGALLALLPQLFLSSVARGVVVCVEADGSSSLELTLAGCCEQEAPQAPAPSEESGDCRSCSDTSFATLEAPTIRDGAGSLSSAVPPAQLVALAPLWTAPPLAAVSSVRPGAVRSPPTTPRSFLSTVVILC